jgi:hypothetical protein
MTTLTSPGRPAALYRLFSADGTLLYIGIAYNPERRMYAHSLAQPWWPEVARHEIDWHPDWDTAYDAESAAIEAGKPRHNLQKQYGAGNVIQWRLPAIHAIFGTGPAYDRLARQLAMMIVDGDFPVGGMLPSGDGNGRYPYSQPVVQRAFKHPEELGPRGQVRDRHDGASPPGVAC